MCFVDLVYQLQFYLHLQVDNNNLCSVKRKHPHLLCTEDCKLVVHAVAKCKCRAQINIVVILVGLGKGMGGMDWAWGGEEGLGMGRGGRTGDGEGTSVRHSGQLMLPVVLLKAKP